MAISIRTLKIRKASLTETCRLYTTMSEIDFGSHGIGVCYTNGIPLYAAVSTRLDHLQATSARVNISGTTYTILKELDEYVGVWEPEITVYYAGSSAYTDYRRIYSASSLFNFWITNYVGISWVEIGSTRYTVAEIAAAGGLFRIPTGTQWINVSDPGGYIKYRRVN